MQSIIASPGEGARLRVIGETVRVLASAAATGGAFEVFELEAPEGSGPVPHAHPWTEAYMVLEGEADVLLDGKKTIATAGCFYHIPAGAKHAYRIRTKTAKFLVITSPAGAHEFFTEVDAETGGSCEDMARVTALAVKHGFLV
jgi:quercetin dioxygenase-like cupin family protein